VFVDAPDVLVVNVVTVVHSQPRTHTTLRRTRVTHRPERDAHGQVVNRGVPRDEVERIVGRPVASHRVKEGARDEGVRDHEVLIRRDPTVERRATSRDVPDDDERRARPPERPEVRPLRTPSDDDVDQRFDAEKQRTTKRHEQERRSEAPDRPSRDALSQEQRGEMEELERAREKERKARDAKKKTPRKTLPKKRG
jgi:hypothetical protein